MKQVLILAAALLVQAWAASGAAGSEEDIAAWRTATFVYDAAKPFGRTTVTIDAGGKAPAGVAALKVATAAFTVDVPPTVFDGQPPPDVGSVRVSSEAGYDKSPWLYISFALTNPKPGQPWDSPRLYVAIQDGKIVKRFLKRWSDGGPRYEDLPPVKAGGAADTGAGEPAKKP